MLYPIYSGREMGALYKILYYCIVLTPKEFLSQLFNKWLKDGVKRFSIFYKIIEMRRKIKGRRNLEKIENHLIILLQLGGIE